MKLNKKALTVAICAVLLICATVFGTLAYLTVESETVTNTFTIGKVDVTLEETDSDEDGDPTENEYEITPGATGTKDPTITVGEGSEDCWVFAKVVEKNNIFGETGSKKKIVSWEKGANWTVYEDGCVVTSDGIYTTTILYYKATGGTEIELHVFKDDQVTYDKDIDSTTAAAIETNPPTIEVTAYAIQADQVDTVADAWAALNA